MGVVFWPHWAPKLSSLALDEHSPTCTICFYLSAPTVDFPSCRPAGAWLGGKLSANESLPHGAFWINVWWVLPVAPLATICRSFSQLMCEHSMRAANMSLGQQGRPGIQGRWQVWAAVGTDTSLVQLPGRAGAAAWSLVPSGHVSCSGSHDRLATDRICPGRVATSSLCVSGCAYVCVSACLCLRICAHTFLCTTCLWMSVCVCVFTSRCVYH